MSGAGADSNAAVAPPVRWVPSPPATPLAALVATVLGGALIIVDGILFALAAGVAASVHFTPLLPVYALVAALDIFVGLGLVILGAFIDSVRPEARRVIGGVSVAFGAIAWFGGGGFLVGTALALAGGLLAIAWQPPAPFVAVPAGERLCPECGRRVGADDCPTCGWEGR